MINVLCNITSCRQELKEKISVTRCLHSFCEKHARSLLTSQKCPICNTPLDKPFDLVQQNSSPPEGLKSMLLVGLHPNTVHEMVRNAMLFWSTQMEQEIQFQSELVQSFQEKLQRQAELEKNFKILQVELHNAKKKCQSLENKASFYQQEIKVLQEKAEENDRLGLIKETGIRNKRQREADVMKSNIKNDFSPAADTPLYETTTRFSEFTEGKKLKIKKRDSNESLENVSKDFVFDPQFANKK